MGVHGRRPTMKIPKTERRWPAYHRGDADAVTGRDIDADLFYESQDDERDDDHLEDEGQAHQGVELADVTGGGDKARQTATQRDWKAYRRICDRESEDAEHGELAQQHQQVEPVGGVGEVDGSYASAVISHLRGTARARRARRAGRHRP